MGATDNAVIGEGVANLLDPWLLKIVVDNVLKSQSTHGWLNHLIFSVTGENKLACHHLSTARRCRCQMKPKSVFALRRSLEPHVADRAIRRDLLIRTWSS